MKSPISRLALFSLILCIAPFFARAQTPPPASGSSPSAAEAERIKTLIAQMREPLRSVPLNLVVEALTGHKVLPFDPAKPNHAEVLKRLNAAAASVAAKIRSEGGIQSKRVNEVGNAIEQYVRDALTAQGMPATIPTGKKSGKARATGYPDIAFAFNGEYFYMDCKTYSAATANTSLRTFYLSPSDDPKISRDAVHLIISFETARAGDTYRLVHYKLISLERLSLDVKYEFNSDNRRMYSDKHGAQTLGDAACE